MKIIEIPAHLLGLQLGVQNPLVQAQCLNVLNAGNEILKEAAKK